MQRKILMLLVSLVWASAEVRASVRYASTTGFAYRINTLDSWACNDAREDARRRAYCNSDETLRESPSSGSCFCNAVQPPFAFPGQIGNWNCTINYTYECEKEDDHPVLTPVPYPDPAPPVVPVSPVYPIQPPHPMPPGHNVCERLGGCPDAHGTRFEAFEQDFKSTSPVTAVPDGTIFVGECYTRRAPRVQDHAALMALQGHLALMDENPAEQIPAPAELPSWTAEQRARLIQGLTRRFTTEYLSAPFVVNGSLAFREFKDFEQRLRKKADGSLMTESHFVGDLAHPETDLSLGYCLFPGSARLR